MDDFNQSNITDTNEETDKKCPQCGGVMAFYPDTGNLKCPYWTFLMQNIPPTRIGA